MYEYYNPNPKLLNVGDCVIRAITKALGISWETAYAGLSAKGFELSDMPSANHVWGAYLRSKGFRRFIIDAEDDNYSVRDFCMDYPSGTYVLALQGHVVAVVNGVYFDSWDSGDERPLYYWRREYE